MNRTHVYVVPEDQVQIYPTVYLGYIRKYGKVIFLLSRDTYEKLNSFKSEAFDVKNESRIGDPLFMRELSEKYGIDDKKSSLLGLSFFACASGSGRFKWDSETVVGNNVILTVTEAKK